MLEFALTVLKPEAENDPPDQLFLLAPAVIQKEDIQVPAYVSCEILHKTDCCRLLLCAKWIKQNTQKMHNPTAPVCYLQVDREPVAMPVLKSKTEAHKEELPSLSILG